MTCRRTWDAEARQRAVTEIDATMGERLRRFNQEACDVARRHPELIGLVAADPWALDAREDSFT
jgi:hypothetical protein